MDVTALAKDGGNLAPYIILIGDLQNQSNADLIIDHEVIAEIECFLDIPIVLMSAYFIFNMFYPHNFYTFMEIMTLKFSSNKAAPTVKHYIANLN